MIMNGELDRVEVNGMEQFLSVKWNGEIYVVCCLSDKWLEDHEESRFKMGDMVSLPIMLSCPDFEIDDDSERPGLLPFSRPSRLSSAVGDLVKKINAYTYLLQVGLPEGLPIEFAMPKEAPLGCRVRVVGELVVDRN